MTGKLHSLSRQISGKQTSRRGMVNSFGNLYLLTSWLCCMCSFQYNFGSTWRCSYPSAYPELCDITKPNCTFACHWGGSSKGTSFVPYVSFPLKVHLVFLGGADRNNVSNLEMDECQQKKAHQVPLPLVKNRILRLQWTRVHQNLKKKKHCLNDQVYRHFLWSTLWVYVLINLKLVLR